MSYNGGGQRTDITLSQCGKCGMNGLHRSGAVLESGETDIAVTCIYCGFIDYGELELTRSYMAAFVRKTNHSREPRTRAS